MSKEVKVLSLEELNELNVIHKFQICTNDDEPKVTKTVHEITKVNEAYIAFKMGEKSKSAKPINLNKVSYFKGYYTMYATDEDKYENFKSHIKISLNEKINDLKEVISAL